MRELEEYSIEPELTLMDAGYYSEQNTDYLMDNGVNFVCRVQSNRLTYKKDDCGKQETLERKEVSYALEIGCYSLRKPGQI
ncbi:transposase [Allobaculum mucilyticum]|nr:transposase [Allobaculum mucilyticum]